MEIAPVESLPPKTMQSIVVGTEVQLADGCRKWAILQNLSLAGQKVNDHLLNITLDVDGSWFPLARYHDPWNETYGTKKLAELLDRKLDEIFPIKYDFRREIKSDNQAFVGEVKLKPNTVFTSDQIMQLVLDSLD